MGVICSALKAVVRKDLWVRVPRPALRRDDGTSRDDVLSLITKGWLATGDLAFRLPFQETPMPR